MKAKAKLIDDKQAPVSGPTTLAVPLYPRSAQVLLDLLEDNPCPPTRQPAYVVIDIDNLRNQLRAHLQRVALGQ